MQCFASMHGCFQKQLTVSDSEVCGHRYKPCVAARVTGRAPDEAEDLLQRYMDGGNRQRQCFELTTPLLRDSNGAVSLMLPGIQACMLPPCCRLACTTSPGCFMRLRILSVAAYCTLSVHACVRWWLCRLIRTPGTHQSRRMQQ